MHYRYASFRYPVPLYDIRPPDDTKVNDRFFLNQSKTKNVKLCNNLRQGILDGTIQ